MRNRQRSLKPEENNSVKSGSGLKELLSASAGDNSHVTAWLVCMYVSFRDRNNELKKCFRVEWNSGALKGQKIFFINVFLSIQWKSNAKILNSNADTCIFRKAALKRNVCEKCYKTGSNGNVVLHSLFGQTTHHVLSYTEESNSFRFEIS